MLSSLRNCYLSFCANHSSPRCTYTPIYRPDFIHNNGEESCTEETAYILSKLYWAEDSFGRCIENQFEGKFDECGAILNCFSKIMVLFEGDTMEERKNTLCFFDFSFCGEWEENVNSTITPEIFDGLKNVYFSYEACNGNGGENNERYL